MTRGHLPPFPHAGLHGQHPVAGGHHAQALHAPRHIPGLPQRQVRSSQDHYHRPRSAPHASRRPPRRGEDRASTRLPSFAEWFRSRRELATLFKEVSAEPAAALRPLGSAFGSEHNVRRRVMSREGRVLGRGSILKVRRRLPPPWRPGPSPCGGTSLPSSTTSPAASARHWSSWWQAPPTFDPSSSTASPCTCTARRCPPRTVRPLHTHADAALGSVALTLCAPVSRQASSTSSATSRCWTRPWATGTARWRASTAGRTGPITVRAAAALARSLQRLNRLAADAQALWRTSLPRWGSPRRGLRSGARGRGASPRRTAPARTCCGSTCARSPSCTSTAGPSCCGSCTRRRTTWRTRASPRSTWRAWRRG